MHSEGTRESRRSNGQLTPQASFLSNGYGHTAQKQARQLVDPPAQLCDSLQILLAIGTLTWRILLRTTSSRPHHPPSQRQHSLLPYTFNDPPTSKPTQRSIIPHLRSFHDIELMPPVCGVPRPADELPSGPREVRKEIHGGGQTP